MLEGVRITVPRITRQEPDHLLLRRRIGIGINPVDRVAVLHARAVAPAPLAYGVALLQPVVAVRARVVRCRARARALPFN